MVRTRLAVLALAALAAASPARADDSDAVFRFFQEEARATTALRRAAPADRSPLAVDVITADEIRASGATEIWDLLRFRVGLDVEEGRSNAGFDRAVVSVRGIPRDSVTELRVMVDGRPVNSPIDGGVLWNRIPVQIQDIERVEIVRGPNAALYGSGAGTGVINVITRAPSKNFEATATGLGGTDGLRQGGATVEAAREKWGARLSAEDRVEGGFPKADGTGTGNDWLNLRRGNFRGWWKPAQDTTLELETGGLLESHGVNATNDPTVFGWDHFQTLKAAREFEGGSSAELRLSRTDDKASENPDANGVLGGTRYWRDEAEAFHSVPWLGGRLRTTYGLDWRYDASSADELYGAGRGVVTNRTLRGFGHQEIKVVDSLSVLGGLSYETANAGGWHKDFQVATLWAPTDDQSFRLSYSRANTKPGLINRYAYQTFPIGGGANGVLLGQSNLKPSPLTDYEAGWNGKFLDRTVSAELTGYYMYIMDHLNLDPAPIPPGFSYAQLYDNSNTVQLRGLEASVKWRFAPGRSAYANFSRETVTDQDGHSLYVNTTPKHKANLGFDAALPWNLRASANAGWKDAYLADSNTGTAQDSIPAFWRMDARLSWTPCPKLELFVAGQNLLAATRREYIDGLVAPRIVYGGATVRW